MDDRQTGAVGDLGDAADIAGGNDIGAGRLDVRDLAVFQAGGDFGLQQIVGAGRAAADMALRHVLHGEAGPGQQRLRFGAQSLPVLHRAGGVIGHDEVGLDHGRGEAEAPYSKDENYVMFEMQLPRRFDMDVEDEDNNTGYWQPKGTSYFISGMYRMVTVVNNFSRGLYSTELNLNKLTPIKVSMLEKHPPGESE